MMVARAKDESQDSQLILDALQAEFSTAAVRASMSTGFFHPGSNPPCTIPSLCRWLRLTIW